MDKAIYKLVADVFVYPDESYPQIVAKAHRALGEVHQGAAEAMAEFVARLPWGDAAEPLLVMEEVYTRSFDVQAITTLDTGYIMFGDDYKRGELLVNLSREHRELGIDCGNELGDHLPNLLRLIAAHEDRALVEDLVNLILGVAMRQMVQEFAPEKVAAKEKLYAKYHETLIEKPGERYGMYGLALRAVYLVLQEDFGLEDVDTPAIGVVDFAATVGQELEIEKDEGNPLGGCGAAGNQGQGPEGQAKGIPGTC